MIATLRYINRLRYHFRLDNDKLLEGYILTELHNH